MEPAAAGSGSRISPFSASGNRSGSTASAPHSDDFQYGRVNDDRLRIRFGPLDRPGDFLAALRRDLADVDEALQTGAEKGVRPLPFEVVRPHDIDDRQHRTDLEAELLEPAGKF